MESTETTVTLQLQLSDPVGLPELHQVPLECHRVSLTSGDEHKVTAPTARCSLWSLWLLNYGVYLIPDLAQFSPL